MVQIKMKWRVRLVDDFHYVTRRSSVIAGGALTAIFSFGPMLLNTWNSIPQDLKDALPHGTAQVVAIAGFVLMIGFRLTKIERIQVEDHAQ